MGKRMRDILDQDLDNLEKSVSIDLSKHYVNSGSSFDVEVPYIDYEAQIKAAEETAEEGITKLARFYLEEERYVNMPYIQYRIRQDAEYYATLDWMIKDGRQTMVALKRQMDQDAGLTQARMYEVNSLLHKEMRENIKLAKSGLHDMQDFYKKLREDIMEMSSGSPGEEADSEGGVATTSATKGKMMDKKQMNSIIEDLARNAALSQPNTDFEF